MKTYNKWKTLSSKIVYKNPWIEVQENEVIKPNGKKGIYGVVKGSPAVYILALDTDNAFYIIRQIRYTTGIDSWEIPAGGAETENLLSAAKRELKEETGVIAEKWKKIGEIQTAAGFSSQISHIFLAKNLTQTDQNETKEEGIIEIKKISFEKAFSMIKKGIITDSESISTITKVALFLNIL